MVKRLPAAGPKAFRWSSLAFAYLASLVLHLGSASALTPPTLVDLVRLRQGWSLTPTAIVAPPRAMGIDNKGNAYQAVGGLGCHTADGQYFSSGLGPEAGSSTFYAMSPLGDGVHWARRFALSGAMRIQVWSYRCGEQAQLLLDVPDANGAFPVATGLGRTGLVALADARFCLVGSEGLRCVTTSGAVTNFAVDTLWQALGVDAGWRQWVETGDEGEEVFAPAEGSRELLLAYPLGDGRIALLLGLHERKSQTQESPGTREVHVAQVALLDPSSAANTPTVVPLSLPDAWGSRPVAAGAAQRSILESARSMLASADGTRLFIAPVQSCVQPGGQPGSAAIGVLALPSAAASPEPTRVALLDPAQSYRIPYIDSHIGNSAEQSWQLLLRLPDGTIGQVRGADVADADALTAVWRISLDPERLDLDLDGVSAAQEALQGTSDWRGDSDGDGRSDTARALGAPAAPQHVPALLHVASGLLHLRLHPGVNGPTWAATPASGAADPEAPLCQAGRCVDRHGRVVALDTPVESARDDHVVAADRRSVWLGAGSAATASVFDFVSATSLSIADWTSLAPLQLAALAGWRVLPVHAGAAWAFDPAPPVQQLWWLQDGAVSLRLDVKDLGCEGGVQACRAAGRIHGSYSIEPAGILPDGRQVLVQLVGHETPDIDDLGLIGQLGPGARTAVWGLVVSPEGTVTVPWPVGGRFAEQGDPADRFARSVDERCARLGFGELPPLLPGRGGVGLFGGARVDAWLDALPGAVLAPTLPRPLWQGHMVAHPLFGAPTPWLELVEAAPVAEPGDTLALEVGVGVPGPSGVGVMLSRIPPRGGVVPLWSRPVPVRDAKTLRASLDASQGNVCLSDGDGIFVFAWDPSATAAPQALPLATATACSLTPRSQGGYTVHAATSAPLQQWSRHLGPDLAPLQDWQAGPALQEEALALVADADGAVRVMTREGAVVGVGRDATQAVCVWADNDELRCGGVLRGVGLRQALEQERVTGQNRAYLPELLRKLRWHLAVRPDGLVLATVAPETLSSGDSAAAIEELRVFDPRNQRWIDADPYQYRGGLRLAQLAGGAAVEPWTGQPLLSVGPSAADTTGGPGPAGGNDRQPASGGGCSAAPVGMWTGMAGVWPTVLAGLVWIRRRRR